MCIAIERTFVHITIKHRTNVRTYYDTVRQWSYVVMYIAMTQCVRQRAKHYDAVRRNHSQGTHDALRQTTVGYAMTMPK